VPKSREQRRHRHAADDGRSTGPPNTTGSLSQCDAATRGPYWIRATLALLQRGQGIIVENSMPELGDRDDRCETPP